MRRETAFAIALATLALAAACTLPGPRRDSAASPPATQPAQAQAMPQTAAAPAATLTLSVYRKTAQGAAVRVPANYPLRSGDSIRIGVTSSQDGFLHLLMKGTTGRLHMAFPDPRIARGTNGVSANQEVVVPAEGWFVMDQTPGVETVYALYSPTREEVFFQAAGQAAAAGAPSTVEADVLAQLNARSRDMSLGGAPAQPLSAAPAPGAAGSPVVLTGQGTLVGTLRLSHE